MLTDYLLANWDKFIGCRIPTSLQVVPISSCLYEYGNDVVLIFTESNISPDYVMKISRSIKYNFKIENEYSALTYLKPVEKLSAYIPSPYYMGNCNQHAFIIQKGISGTSLSRIIRKDGMNNNTFKLLDQVVDLLLLINSTKVSNGSHPKENLADLLDECGTDLIHHGLTGSFIEELKEYVNLFSNMNNNYFLHGDYWHTNIVVENNSICGIIDWEFSVPDSNVPTDIIWFLINLGHCLHFCMNQGESIPERFKWVFFTKGEHSELMSMLYRKYSDGFGLDDNLFSILMKITLLKMSLRELASYGRHTNMDFICLDMLKYLMQNERRLSFS